MRRFMVLLGFLVSSGCDLFVAPYHGAVGVYTLRSVDNKTLPLEANGVTFVGGTVRLFHDSTFFDATMMRHGTRLVADTIKGVFSVDADSVRFTPTDGGPTTPYSGALSGSRLTVPWVEGQFEYRRQ